MRAFLTSPAAVGSALAILFCSTLAATAGDWPCFRGANRDGVSTETGLLHEWPAGGPRLAWKSAGIGAGFSTVSVVGERLYTAGDKGETSYVSACSVADGKVIWSTRLGKAGAPGWGNFAGTRSTPSVAGKQVFAIGQWGEVACYEIETGKELWRKDLVADFGGRRPEWGYSESPLVDGELVVMTPGGAQGAVVALNRLSGTVVWQSKEFTDAAHYSSLIVAEIGGVKQYIQLTDKSVAGIAAADGKVLWRAERKGSTAVIPTPIYSDGMVYVTSGYGAGCNGFKVTQANGAFSVSQVYANKGLLNQHGGAVKVGEYVYGYSDDKGWTCQEFKTGAIKWQDKSKLGKGSLVCADGQLYLRREDKPGTVALIEASPAGFVEHGRFDQPELSGKNTWAHPVVADGKLYLRDGDLLFCYDVKSK
jgi:outer membrane protein assembly factor BamB